MRFDSREKSKLVSFVNDSKAQGALEVLLILVIVIIVATTIGLYLKNKVGDISENQSDAMEGVMSDAEGN